MKQCEPLKEPLHVPEGCAPCPPELKDYAKKKKAKRRQQKQARRRNK